MTARMFGTAVAALSLSLAVTGLPAYAQSGSGAEAENPGMQRMHERMMSGENPGMQRMHERMMSGENRGMQQVALRGASSPTSVPAVLGVALGEVI